VIRGGGRRNWILLKDVAIVRLASERDRGSSPSSRHSAQVGKNSLAEEGMADGYWEEGRLD
jgi:hypothetical protein